MVTFIALLLNGKVPNICSQVVYLPFQRQLWGWHKREISEPKFRLLSLNLSFPTTSSHHLCWAVEWMGFRGEHALLWFAWVVHNLACGGASVLMDSFPLGAGAAAAWLSSLARNPLGSKHNVITVPLRHWTLTHLPNKMSWISLLPSAHSLTKFFRGFRIHQILAILPIKLLILLTNELAQHHTDN